jgi:hypothetical protein
VSTLVHANKGDEVSREGGSQPFQSICPEGDQGKSVCKRPACNPKTEKKACVCLKECIYIPA